MGDKVGIVSPSSLVPGSTDQQFRSGIAYLEALGFEVVTGRHALSTDWGYSASPLEKASDIHQMFSDPSIRAIICSQGGATANACLPYLDWEFIRENPKIFLGISDITVLLNAIYHRTGLVTFHGNDLMWGFGRHPTLYDRSEFVRWLVDGANGEVQPNARMQMEDILLRVSEGNNFPILKTNDFGHNCPNTVLPVGAIARLEADHCHLKILEFCVK